MKVLNPETIYSRGANDDERRSWTERNWSKLKRWTQALSGFYVPQGYGGLYLETPVGAAIPLTTTWQQITAFDAEITENPKAVNSDKPSASIAILEPGAWFWEFAAVGEISAFTSNSAQTIELASYNVTQATAALIAYHPVPRYSDVMDLALSGMRMVPSAGLNLGDQISLYIRIRTATPAITVNSLEQLELSVFRVGT